MLKKIERSVGLILLAISLLSVVVLPALSTRWRERRIDAARYVWTDHPHRTLVVVLVLLAFVLLVVWWRSRHRSIPKPAGEARDADIRLYEQFQAVLPADGRVVRFLHDHPFDAQFQHELLSPLDVVRNDWAGPDKQFHDRAIRAKAEAFRAALADFHEASLDGIFSINGSWMGVPPEWELQQPDRMRDAVAALDATSSAAAVAYDELVATARERLVI